MRRLTTGFALGAVLLAAACNNWPHLRQRDPQARTFERSPSAEQLVAYLNTNAQKVQGLECRRVMIDVTQAGQSVSIESDMVCQKPRNFRLIGRVVGNTEVDMGSNDQEFWYWVKRADPHVFYCSYDDFRRGVRMPFPFQPDWIMEALGVASYDETKKYEVREGQTAIELIERTTSPQGQPIRKVTVFNRGPAAAGKPQVTAYLLQDAAGKEIASASISHAQRDPATGAVLPQIIRFVWPAEKVEMRMKLDGVRVGPIDPQRAAGIFNRRNLANLPSYDLARGPEQPLQRAGGVRTQE